MGSDESHFNVSVGSDGQSHRTVIHKDSIHKPQPFRRGRRAEADGNRGRSAYRWAKLANKPERPFIACKMTGIARSWQSAWPPGGSPLVAVQATLHHRTCTCRGRTVAVPLVTGLKGGTEPNTYSRVPGEIKRKVELDPQIFFRYLVTK